MADPVEPLTWRTLQAIGERLSGISIADGYYTNLGAAPRYYDRSQRIESDDATPFVVILADEMPTNEQASGTRTTATDMAVTIEYAIPFDAENPELVAHRGRADIVRRLMTDLRGMPTGFRNLRITGSRITNAPEPGSDLVIAQVQARASLSESIPPA